MTVQFANAGQLSILGTVIHTGATSNGLSIISHLKFNNTIPYVLTLSIYKADTAITTVLYTLNLAAGDIVTDDVNYGLEFGDQLIATSSVAGTNYYVLGLNN